MADYYLDSSALVKRYVNERGTTWIRSLLQQGTPSSLFVVQVAGPEVVSAFFRKARGGQSTLYAAQQAASAFHVDWSYLFRVVAVIDNIVSAAIALAEKHYLRGYDAVHLAAVLEVQRRLQAVGAPPLTFVSADLEQLNAAGAEGLPVENPDNYT